MFKREIYISPLRHRKLYERSADTGAAFHSVFFFVHNPLMLFFRDGKCYC